MAKMASLHAEKIRTLNEFEWDMQYEPITDSPLQDHGKDLELVMLFPSDRVWTLVEADDDKLFIRNGYHLVNRIGYHITQKPWHTEEDITVEVR